MSEHKDAQTCARYSLASAATFILLGTALMYRADYKAARESAQDFVNTTNTNWLEMDSIMFNSAKVRMNSQ